jgi:hypothetical protein
MTERKFSLNLWNVHHCWPKNEKQNGRSPIRNQKYSTHKDPEHCSRTWGFSPVWIQCKTIETPADTYRRQDLLSGVHFTVHEIHCIYYSFSPVIFLFFSFRLSHPLQCNILTWIVFSSNIRCCRVTDDTNRYYSIKDKSRPRRNIHFIDASTISSITIYANNLWSFLATS